VNDEAMPTVVGARVPPNSYLDFSEIAGLYSQLAGVLAGFSFAASEPGGHEL
jgi:hypothetical protein